MPAAVCLGDQWRIAMVELLRYGSARFATTSQANPPLCVSSRQAKRRVRLAGGLWDPILCYCLIFIDHFLAYMNIRRGYKIYTRVGDFDPPTHQPTSYNILGYIQPNACSYICYNILGYIQPNAWHNSAHIHVHHVGTRRG